MLLKFSSVVVTNLVLAAASECKKLMVLRTSQSGSSWLWSELSSFKNSNIKYEYKRLPNFNHPEFAFCQTVTGITLDSDLLYSFFKVKTHKLSPSSNLLTQWATNVAPPNLYILTFYRTNIVKAMLSIQHKRTNCKVVPHRVINNLSSNKTLSNCRGMIYVDLYSALHGITRKACEMAIINQTSKILQQSIPSFSTYSILYEEMQINKVKVMNSVEKFLGWSPGTLYNNSRRDDIAKLSLERASDSLFNYNETHSLLSRISAYLQNENGAFSYCPLDDMLAAEFPTVFPHCDFTQLCTRLTSLSTHPASRFEKSLLPLHKPGFDAYIIPPL
mmetsp:Transcript_1126/g.1644  ORF Transcript_1126/g.1644 Transcript_1126/m.1644 type:complete len:331 (-) Transcript_1126:177-1169(-)